jgi:calcineurin-like phosphoesterase
MHKLYGRKTIKKKIQKFKLEIKTDFCCINSNINI